ncbi:restriction endonuclease subunit S [Vagococcus lutrae]|uniref:restriction endonuclease subunit S n=1 Tax=Vagococcus lutrae TaxID=81947 RepID=UPI002A81F5A3|nr:restriction endonuclease subunit S [Vagococcus lutrae]MDY3705839.1 restriction endonuclease subunit S [Vagococcus lutrae]
MKTIKKQPKIRFKGYTDEWQQRKLGEIIQVNSGKDYKHLNKGEIPVYGTGGYMLSVDEALSYKDAIGLGRKGTINKPYLLKAPFWTVDTLFYSIPINNNDLLFINTLFQNINWKKYDESTGVPSLSKNSIIRIEKKVPNIEEQEKIGLFFLKLSDTIALHQRKLEALEKTKKSFLQKMFPKKDETKPEIRFSGFTDDWEQRKLGDFLSIPKKEKVTVTDSNDLMTLKLNLGGIDTGSNRETLKIGATTYYRRYAGQFIYGKQNFFNGSIAIIPKQLDGKATSGDVPSLDINYIDTNYFYYFVSRESYWKSKESMSSGTGSKRIHEKTLLNFGINVPTKSEEQQKIGSFFKQLDDTIALHQRQLEVLKNMKTSFLQKMYI